MAAIDNIRDLAQDVYYSVNGAENDDTGKDLTTFENNFIRAFNLWVREYETEAYWTVARENDYTLGTVSSTTTFSFNLPDDYRTPVFNRNKYLKFIIDGIVVSKFKLVDPNQRQVDDDVYRPDRATFMPDPDGGGTIVLSRAPLDHELTASMVLDVVKRFPTLTRTDDTVLNWIYSKRIATLGIAKNITLADVTKVSLSPSFAQQYLNELNKAININNASNENDEMKYEGYDVIGGIW